jgi:hypothetical protein
MSGLLQRPSRRAVDPGLLMTLTSPRSYPEILPAVAAGLLA